MAVHVRPPVPDPPGSRTWPYRGGRANTRGKAAIRVAAGMVAASLALSICLTPVASAVAPMCFGKAATIIGTAGPDTLFAPTGSVVFGRGGDDLIEVDGGYACGGLGDDHIVGLGNDDHVDGGGGNDHLDGDDDGGGGVDVLLGGSGADTLTDFEDSDYPHRDPGTDILRGGDGDDMIRSWNGSDKLYGDRGHDSLSDTTGMTTYMYGGPDNDTFSSYYGNEGCGPLQPDYIFGGLGFDTAYLDEEPGAQDVASTSTETLVVQPHVAVVVCN